MECLIEPLGSFGDHKKKEYSGCTWCKQRKACVKKTFKNRKEERRMDVLKTMLQEIVKTEKFGGQSAKEYYDRLLKNSWKEEAMELYEESLNRDEFIAHNTILSTFADEIDVVELRKLTNKKGGKKMAKKGKTKPVTKDKKGKTKPVTENKDISQIGMDQIGIQKGSNKVTSTPKTTLKDILSFSSEDVAKSSSVEELADGAITLINVIKGTKDSTKSAHALAKVATVLGKELTILHNKHKAEMKLAKRKSGKITKVGVGKKPGETGKEVESVDEALEGLKFDAEHLNAVKWTMLKKIASKMNVESFGRSKKFVVKKLIAAGKKKKK